jgi:hypothetical protein
MQYRSFNPAKQRWLIEVRATAAVTQEIYIGCHKRCLGWPIGTGVYRLFFAFLISRFFDAFTCGVYLLTPAATGSQLSPTHLSWKKISILTYSPEPYRISTQIPSSTSGHGSDFAPSKRMLCAGSSISRSRPLQRPRPQAPSQTRQWTWRLPNSKRKRHRNAQRLQKVSRAVSEERQSLFTQDGKVYREDHWHPKIMVSHYNPPITASIEPH